MGTVKCNLNVNEIKWNQIKSQSLALHRALKGHVCLVIPVLYVRWCVSQSSLGWKNQEKEYTLKSGLLHWLAWCGQLSTTMAIAHQRDQEVSSCSGSRDSQTSAFPDQPCSERLGNLEAVTGNSDISVPSLPGNLFRYWLWSLGSLAAWLDFLQHVYLAWKNSRKSPTAPGGYNKSKSLPTSGVLASLAKSHPCLDTMEKQQLWATWNAAPSTEATLQHPSRPRAA